MHSNPQMPLMTPAIFGFDHAFAVYVSSPEKLDLPNVQNVFNLVDGFYYSQGGPLLFGFLGYHSAESAEFGAMLKSARVHFRYFYRGIQKDSCLEKRTEAIDLDQVDGDSGPDRGRRPGAAPAGGDS